MKVKVANASSKKTRKLIRDAFTELIKEKKTLNKITVTELVERANITRGSFYTHFDNIYEVALEFQNEALETCFMNMKELASPEDVNKYFDYVFAYLKDNEDTYEKLLSSDEPYLFINRLNKKIYTHVQSIIKHNDKNTELNIIFFVDGALHLILRYFKKETDLSLDEINLYIQNMFKKMFFAMQ